MHKIVINSCFGSFDLSEEALSLYKQKSGSLPDYVGDLKRDDPILVSIVESLGEKSHGLCSQLRIVEIPDDVKEWYISEFDGLETIHENHRSWSI